MAQATALLFLLLFVGSAYGGANFLMVIGGIKLIGDQNVQTDEVQVVSLEPELHPVPGCLSDLVNPFPISISDMAGGALNSGILSKNLLNYNYISLYLPTYNLKCLQGFHTSAEVSKAQTYPKTSPTCATDSTQRA